jgi:hypothetical protein
VLEKLAGTQMANLVNIKGVIVAEFPVRDIVDKMKAPPTETSAIVFDGIITQKVLDSAAEGGLKYVVGQKTANITKMPANVEVWTKTDLE